VLIVKMCYNIATSGESTAVNTTVNNSHLSYFSPATSKAAFDLGGKIMNK